MLELFIKLLVMLLATNGAPVLLARVFQSHGAQPLDLGRQLYDGRPILGSSKTWRGLAAALVTSSVLSMLFGYGTWFGLIFGVLVMTGDLISSFIKRRIGLAPSDQCMGLDQLPESFIPSVYAVGALGVDWWWAVLLALAFMLLGILISRPLFWLNIRNRPY
ncbi:MAG: CDP-archaeol synthase [Gammaproteobacteria bacterium]|nr:MAG: CDP-archaeol synthase [Gammaproteobacteria bacterium]